MLHEGLPPVRATERQRGSGQSGLRGRGTQLMSVLLAFAAAVLFGVGTYLVLQRKLSRIIIGLGLLTHGANVLLLTSGQAGDEPLIGVGDAGDFADPLPHALALTAIVITFGVSALLLAMAFRSWILPRRRRGGERRRRHAGSPGRRRVEGSRRRGARRAGDGARRRCGADPVSERVFERVNQNYGAFSSVVHRPSSQAMDHGDMVHQ